MTVLEVTENIPLRLKDLRPHNSKLCHNTDNIKMRPVRKQKVPKPQHLRQGRRTRTQRQYRRKSVDFGRKPLCRQIHAELGVDNRQHLVHQGEPAVHAVHGASDVAGTLAGEQGVEGDEGFGFASRGVEERGG